MIEYATMNPGKPSSTLKRRLNIRVEGMVQGVGFRHSTVIVAGRHPVTGFVRNEPDGSVVIVAEGTEPDLLRFQNDLREMAVYGFVRKEQWDWEPATGEFHRFEVRY
ncbi:MAG: acylphosphatase [Kiritimatiellae bacterium]|nr:acylphosphatase [Kiritimatiellia bacterium]MDW8458710.1 acylphosphatase [Verrucomicrobiota bacterium]